MIPEIGQFALIVALLLALLQGILPIAGAARSNAVLMGIARPLAVGQFVFVAIAFGCLTTSFLANDFSVLYVAQHSNSELPAAYHVAAVWGGHDAVAALGSPPLDAALLARELEQTERVFLRPRGLVDDSADGRHFLVALAALCERLGAQTPVACHRDFMARNLVPVGARGEAVLDFQDLRLGPPDYDLASLLNDSLFPPAAIEARLLERATGSPTSSEGYLRAVAQRALKAVGTFAAFAARGNPRHLPLVAPTLARAARALARLPETAEAWARLAPRFRAELPAGSDLLD